MEKKVLYNLYSQGQSLSDIGKILGMSTTSIFRRFKKYNIKTDPKRRKKIIFSSAARRKIQKRMMGNKNPMWKGDKVKRCALHEWVKRRKPKPRWCKSCHKRKPYDLTNISDKYLRALYDWEWLCRRCHMLKDGRLIRLVKNRHKVFYIKSKKSLYSKHNPSFSAKPV